MNLIEIIAAEIMSDTECSDKQSKLLIEAYLESQNKTEIDKCFICLCGFALATMIEMAS